MARKPKAHISMREKLASALAHMMVEVDGKLERAIPYDDAKRMTSQEVCSLFQFDHGIHEAIDGPTEHWNLTPRLIAEHRRKTAKVDRPRIAKTGRNEEAHEAFRLKMLAKAGQSDASDVEENHNETNAQDQVAWLSEAPGRAQVQLGE
jgi:hypothetical protein